jgi:paraquat-inducible protein B
VHVLVKTNFAALVRTNSVWWNAGGINVDLHFFGIKVGAENVKSLVMGGVAFATPPDLGPLAKTGTSFTLHDKVEDKWLKWSPAIALTNTTTVAPSGAIPALNLNNINSSAGK